MILLADLPVEILAVVIDQLDIDETIALSETSRALNALVKTYGWRAHLLRHPRYSHSTAYALSAWPPLAQVQYHTRTDKTWSARAPAAFPLARAWRGKLQPVLVTSPSRLAVAAGHFLYTYAFSPHAEPGKAPAVRAELVCALGGEEGDATALAFVPDGGEDRALVVGFASGALDYVRLPDAPPPNADGSAPEVPLPPASAHRVRFYMHPGELVVALSCADGRLASFTSVGSTALLDLNSGWAPDEARALGVARGWAALLPPSGGVAAFGTASRTPLLVHALTPTGLSAAPIAAPLPAPDDAAPARSAVYGLAPAPPTAPWGAPGRTLLSGWYDGFVRLFDLRAPAQRPALALCDPWQFEPVYSVGAAGARVGAGAARHSVVALWDARAPRAPGFSVHAPANDPSPVYSIVVEEGRVFGGTQSRAFGLEFGGGQAAKEVRESWPPFVWPAGKRREGRGAGYPVTIYGHEGGEPSARGFV